MTHVLTIAQTKTPLVDPHDCTDAKDALTILRAVFDTLITPTPGGFAPALAEHWTVNDDAQNWRFRLRSGVAFHDGSPCDAAAVVASLKRMARPDKGYTLGAPGVWHQYLGDADIRAEDQMTVTLQLSEPVADLLDILVQGFIAAPSSLAALDAGDRVWIGTGPYRLKTAQKHIVEATQVKGHFGGDPTATSIIWRAILTPEKRLDALRSGAAHLATGLDATATDELGAGLTRHDSPDPVAIIYLLNAAIGPMKNALVRRALSLAIDREAVIAQVMNGAARPLHGLVSPAHFGAGHATVPYDPDLAQALLAQAGHAGGLALKVDCPIALPDEAEALTQELARQLAKIGITLDVTRHEDREAYAHMVRRKEIGDMCVFDSSPMSTFRVIYEKIDARMAGSWWQGYHSPAIEALLDRARSEVATAVREGIYQDIYRLLQGDPPWLTLYNPIQTIGFSGHHPAFQMPTDGVLDVRTLPTMG